MSPRRTKAPLAEELTETVTEEDIARAWPAVVRAHRSRRRARRARRLAAGAVAAAALLAALSLAGEPAAAPSAIRHEDGRLLSTIGASEVAPLDDGSRIEVSDEGRLEVLSNRADATALHLVAGAASFWITPRTGRRWTVEAAGATVEVVGTVFRVDRRVEGRVVVEVQRGQVLVRGANVPDGVRRVSAGERVVIESPRPSREPPPAPAPPRSAGRDRARAEGAPEPAPRNAPAAVAPSELLVAADRARASGDGPRAARLLRQLVASAPRSAEAPYAAYTLARLHGEAGRRAAAVRWYRRARSLGLPPELERAAEAAIASEGGASTGGASTGSASTGSASEGSASRDDGDE